MLVECHEAEGKAVCWFMGRMASVYIVWLKGQSDVQPGKAQLITRLCTSGNKAE